jgi:hypothetical protein
MSQDSPIVIGDRVFHQKYHDGTVTGFYGDKHVAVMFDRVGVKRVVPSFLRLREAPATSHADIAPQPSAEILPFPTARCQALVRRAVDSGDDGYLTKHQARLEALGVDPALAEADTAALANAMRTYWIGQHGRKATA